VDFDIAQNKIGESAQRVVDRAVEECRRREHALLSTEHILLAFAQADWETFSQVMRDLELNPHEILHNLEDHLRGLPTLAGRQACIAPETKLVFKLALLHASRSGRQTLESLDLFSAIFEESQGVPVSLVRRHGVEPEVLVSRIATRIQENELREELLRKRFELPATLKQFGTNLNLLARQDKIARVHGRDQEIQQLLEILCHRERSNSAMLIGEPGVGKTAIVEAACPSPRVRTRDCPATTA
jgi:ATP-dependent Clp protease ATP-binding subunit ClpC